MVLLWIGKLYLLEAEKWTWRVLQGRFPCLQRPVKNQRDCVKCRFWPSSSRIGPEHVCGQREGTSEEWCHALGRSVFPVTLFVGWAGPSLLPGLFLVTKSGGCSLDGGFSRCRAQARGRVGFRSWGPRPGSPGSIAVALGLSCCMARGIVPDQGSNPALLHWQLDSLPLSHQGSPMRQLLNTPA